MNKVSTKEENNLRLHGEIFLDDMDAFATDMQICHVPLDCDVMIGNNWNRSVHPIVDWETDRILVMEQVMDEILEFGKLRTEILTTRAIEMAKFNKFSSLPPVLKVSRKRISRKPPFVGTQPKRRIVNTLYRKFHKLDDGHLRYFHKNFETANHEPTHPER